MKFPNGSIVFRNADTRKLVGGKSRAVARSAAEQAEKAQDTVTKQINSTHRQ